jgi:hypothetical protein
VDYVWDHGATTASDNATPTVDTEYIVTVTDANGCSDSDSVMINVFSVTADAGADQDICLGETATLSASGGSSYAWSTGDNTQDINVSPTADTEYYVTVTGVNSCTDEDTIQVNVLTAPGTLETPVGISERCSGPGSDTITVEQVSGADTYQWFMSPVEAGSTTANDTSLIIDWSAAFTGNVFVHASAENQCGTVTSDSLEISITPTPVFELGSDTTLCNGDSIQLQGPAADSYLWSNTSTSDAIWVNSENTYWLEAVLSGCSFTDSIEISTSDASVDLGTDTIYASSFPISLDAGSGFSEYLWSTGETSQSIEIFSDGIYHVQVINASGCEASDTVCILDVTSMSDNKKPDISIYPNPADDEVMIKINGQPDCIEFYSSDGRLLRQVTARDSLMRINTAHWEPGIYLVKTSSAGGIHITKLLIR